MGWGWNYGWEKLGRVWVEFGIGVGESQVWVELGFGLELGLGIVGIKAGVREILGWGCN